MPSDHSSIAARHRARTLSRAKSLRKHERWLVQQHDRHHSQPNLHATDSDKQYFGDSLLRRATSFCSQRSRGTSTSDATGFERLVSPRTSDTALINFVSPNTPPTGLSNARSGFPWNEVNWNRSRRKLGLSSSIRHLLTPYPATTTRQVSNATAESVNKFSAGELDAVTCLRQTRRSHAPMPAATQDTTITTPITTPQHQVNQSFSQARTASRDSTSTLTTTDSNTTSSSQVPDSDALMHLYAATAAVNARLRPKSLPRAQTYAHLTSEPGRSERSSLPSHTHLQTESKGRDKSPPRHQRDRHPQLVYPYAPGHGSSTLQERVRKRSAEPTATLEASGKPQMQWQQPHPTGKSLKVTRFINGYCRCVSIPHSPQHHTDTKLLLTSTEDDASSANGDETRHFTPGETIWSRTRSSISSLASTTNLRVGFVAEKVRSWSSGPRRLF